MILHQYPSPQASDRTGNLLPRPSNRTVSDLFGLSSAGDIPGMCSPAFGGFQKEDFVLAPTLTILYKEPNPAFVCLVFVYWALA